jgi:hypothetical protein
MDLNRCLNMAVSRFEAARLGPVIAIAGYSLTVTERGPPLPPFLAYNMQVSCQPD